MTDNSAPLEESQELGMRLNEILSELGQAPLDSALADRFGVYVALLIRWNARMNLTAVRDAEGILRRHVVESIACARFLPVGIATLLDFGSGAGFPGIPIALTRPEIAVTLAESQGKKAAFLHEAARVLGFSVKIYGGRAELLAERYDCVALRAVDRMGSAVASGSELTGDEGYLALLTTRPEEQAVVKWARGVFSWASFPLPSSSERVLLLGQKGIVPRGTLESPASNF